MRSVLDQARLGELLSQELPLGVAQLLPCHFHCFLALAAVDDVEGREVKLSEHEGHELELENDFAQGHEVEPRSNLATHVEGLHCVVEEAGALNDLVFASVLDHVLHSQRCLEFEHLRRRDVALNLNGERHFYQVQRLRRMNGTLNHRDLLWHPGVVRALLDTSRSCKKVSSCFRREFLPGKAKLEGELHLIGSS